MAFGQSVIKSVQRGSLSVAPSATATITSVDVDKSVVLYGGSSTAFHYSLADHGGGMLAYVTLTNATTVTANRTYATAHYAATLTWQVIEYY